MNKLMRNAFHIIECNVGGSPVVCNRDHSEVRYRHFGWQWIVYFCIIVKQKHFDRYA